MVDQATRRGETLRRLTPLRTQPVPSPLLLLSVCVGVVSLLLRQSAGAPARVLVSHPPHPRGVVFCMLKSDALSWRAGLGMYAIFDMSTPLRLLSTRPISSTCLDCLLKREA